MSHEFFITTIFRPQFFPEGGRMGLMYISVTIKMHQLHLYFRSVTKNRE